MACRAARDRAAEPTSAGLGIVRSMTKWEYQVAPVLNHVAAQILNNFGQDGWELVTLIPGQGGNDIAYFKRPAE